MSRNSKNREVWDALIMVLQFGINMIVPILLCLMAGVWLGNKLGIGWLCVPLFFVGALAGGTNIYKIVRKMIREAEKDDRNHASSRLYGILEQSGHRRREHAQKDQ